MPLRCDFPASRHAGGGSRSPPTTGRRARPRIPGVLECSDQSRKSPPAQVRELPVLEPRDDRLVEAAQPSEVALAQTGTTPRLANRLTDGGHARKGHAGEVHRAAPSLRERAWRVHGAVVPDGAQSALIRRLPPNHPTERCRAPGCPAPGCQTRRCREVASRGEPEFPARPHGQGPPRRTLNSRASVGLMEIRT